MYGLGLATQEEGDSNLNAEGALKKANNYRLWASPLQIHGQSFLVLGYEP